MHLQVLVSGAHLSPEFGETWRAIEQDGFQIDAKVEMLLSSDTPVGVLKSMGLGIVGYAEALERLRPDVLVVLGDRYEALAVAQAALILKIPLAHLHGGEITAGAYDDAIRHAISKMANLHFTAADSYRRRLIQMGEDPGSVFNVGALGLDHLLHERPMMMDALSESLRFDVKPPYFLVTYHPVTLGNEQPESSCRAMLMALDRFPEHKVILTYPNADNGGRRIIPLIDDYARSRPDRVLALPSLGFKRYLSALAHADAVVGNSSSGIIEAPSLGVPTVNIGVRQQGRLAAKSVVNCGTAAQEIEQATRKVISPDFPHKGPGVVNPYGQGNAAEQVVSILRSKTFSSMKYFHDLEFQA
ncbi:UDP-N-acetylglucosamine 2-epimerase [plant metagenome]|uniref:UDP-N-acetylglucosamine 2-epimerase n=1 Tax=plant metagenome TaxID=1297885 RepID=A0A484SN14_9ZZZZ